MPDYKGQTRKSDRKEMSYNLKIYSVALNKYAQLKKHQRLEARRIFEVHRQKVRPCMLLCKFTEEANQMGQQLQTSSVLDSMGLGRFGSTSN